MSVYLSRRMARAEARSALDRHVNMLEETRKHSLSNNAAGDQFLYLMAIPIIYSAWEGYFKIIFSVCFKRKCDLQRKVSSYPEIFAVLWLQKQGFFQSYLKKLFAAMQMGQETVPKTGAQYRALADFARGFSAWSRAPVDHTIQFDSLVMTYSNVNLEVLKLNAEVIGLNLAGVRTGGLDELVGRRNDVAHGGLVVYPTNIEVDELISYAESLMRTLDIAVSGWMDSN